MPHGATSEDYNNESNLKDFIAENAKAWYKHALEHDLEHNRHGIYRHSLYLVTGNIKSKSWGIATTSGITSLPFRSLILEESSDPEQPAYTWNNEGLRLLSRTGPNPISPLNVNGTKLPHTENQCLYLHGFKISLSEDAWNDINVALNECGKLPRVAVNQHTLQLHPLHKVNEQMLSQFPRARVAITHDKQSYAVRGDGKDKVASQLSTKYDWNIKMYIFRMATCCLVQNFMKRPILVL
ncbi:hypothetical protein BDQ17DRAFT_1430241 [Cyathus striatus]|nr:hypothetical protein BDQ17DRAFT_1430241 [Cyathus striatus]